ncbi:MAG: sodium:proton antiporter NhaD [Oligoflexia bacterium]|nr:sodium:proton antiporter NhaD [Oligoflexia bacterium]MBF0366757.1 sodium:proton antiporter NhaD [Oligoflexia bacterium]
MGVMILIVLFVFFYLLIIFEHPLKINKGAVAIFAGAVLWILLPFVTTLTGEFIHEKLFHHLVEIASIIFFLKGAMSIVEIIDSCHGINLITDSITTRTFVNLLWIIAVISFFLSAVLDNLTTSIVMMSFVRKIKLKSTEVKILASIIIIAANAGGAWSPIGDVTTTMLWITGRISSIHTIEMLILPSIVSLLAPLIVLSFRYRHKVIEMDNAFLSNATYSISRRSSAIVLFTGVVSLILVPIIKQITGLPPFVGIFFGFGLTWIVSEIFVGRKQDNTVHIPDALQKVDLSNIYFFIGILLSVAALESAGILKQWATTLSHYLTNMNVFVSILGILSAVIDNVPLVAGTISMYGTATYPIDHSLWTLLAFAAGTGGSLLIIGSAAGVAIMNTAKIDFFWYLKYVTPLALLGYLLGIAFYLLQVQLLS